MCPVTVLGLYLERVVLVDVGTGEPVTVLGLCLEVLDVNTGENLETDAPAIGIERT